MNNDLSLIQNQVGLAPSSVMQKGAGSAYISHTGNGNVIVNQFGVQRTLSGSPEELMRIKALNNQYYHLLVLPDSDFKTTGKVRFPSVQVLCERNVPKEIAERSLLQSEEGIRELMTFPVLICQENTGYHGETEEGMLVYYAYFESVDVLDSMICASFHTLGWFSQKILCSPEIAPIFDLNMGCDLTDLNYCGWTMHKMNLFAAFEQAGIQNMPRPY